ncbi:MAG: SRPBCC family protein, partial [Chlorobi bacterium]|nr:SRPBCC family protein [Chlorobiota bacterium]
MKILKYSLIAFLSIIVIFFIIGLMLDSKATVTRSIEINAPAKYAFNLINNTAKWADWSPWVEKDPNMKVVLEGPAAGVGAVRKWESDVPEVGFGDIEIIKSTEYTNIKANLNFSDMSMSAIDWTFVEKAGRTTLTWTSETEFGSNYIMRYLGLGFDSMMG